MITKVPNSWKYSDELEMLYLFYQKTDELLSEQTPDSYALPLHNCLTLLNEAGEIYALLKQFGLVESYYVKYISPILEEFIAETERDYVFKRIVGLHLPTIRTAFTEAQKESRHFKIWFDTVKQICPVSKYITEYEEEIIDLIVSTKDKEKLLYCTANYFISLRRTGYSREHLYQTAKRYFDNHSVKISSATQIEDFLDLFPLHTATFRFLILLDIDSIEYMDSITDNLTVSRQIKKLDIAKERKGIETDYACSEMLKEYDKRRHDHGPHKKMAIVRYEHEDYDPYSAAMQFCDYIAFLQSFSRYFKHHYFSKQVYMFLLENDDKTYREIKIPNKTQKRPFIAQEKIDSRIQNILRAKSMGAGAFHSITNAIMMHAEAFDSRSTETLIKSFWTALETLFSSPETGNGHEGIKDSLIPIIQKTYLLKKLRILYLQLTESVDESSLIELGIFGFPQFIHYFSEFSENSPEMKKIYALLSENPLLRGRLYRMRKSLSSGLEIKKTLEEHQIRIQWQLRRLYRIRNISTHLGQTVNGADVAVNHLHNYFDYVVNYMLCCSENGDYIVNTPAVVFKAKEDNKMHIELLKEGNPLSKDNYTTYLFGPDPNIIRYEFE